MGEISKIEWTDASFNPWIGCQHVSCGCDGCYAEAFVKHKKLLGVVWGSGENRVRTATPWKMVRKLQRQAPQFLAEHGRRRRVFTASFADVFDNKAPAGARDDMWKLIRECPNLDFQLLTKRPQNIAKMLPKDWENGYPNVWLGTTTENQEEYERRWPVLSAIPATIRFLSYEPAIGPLVLADGAQPDWLICGGESGGKARAMDPAWARAIRDDCNLRGIAFFMKQWGTYRSNPIVVEQGLKPMAAKEKDAFGKGGGLLDGKLHRAFPGEEQAA